MSNITFSVTSSPFQFSQNSSEILQGLKGINSSRFFWQNKELARKLKAVSPIELHQVLQSLLVEMLEQGAVKDPLKAFERILSVIPLEKLQQGNGDSLLKELEEKVKEAKLYLETTQQNISPTLRVHLSNLLDTLVAVIEGFISAFGIARLFKPSESDVEADFKTQAIFRLIALFGFISTTVFPIVGAAAGAQVLVTVFLSISALSVVWPYIQPAPKHLPANAVNVTKEVQMKPSGAYGRKGSLDQIYDILKRNRHALLVGPSRVGKSLTVRAFAEAVERGDYPKFKGKKVFCFNTTDLLDQKAPAAIGGGNSILHKISEKIGRHKKDVILVFDEIHMACKNNEKIADQFKTFLDEGGDFAHVIGITTIEESHYVRENNAFSLRFDDKDVFIQNTNHDETLKILGDTVLKNPSSPLLEEGILEYVYKRSGSDVSQPSSARNLLKKCINRTDNSERSPTEKKVIEIESRIRSLRTQAAAMRGMGNNFSQEIENLEKQLEDLEPILAAEKKEIEKLFKIKSFLDTTTKECYQAALKVRSAVRDQYLKQYLLLQKVLNPFLMHYLKDKSQELGVKVILDRQLVDSVVQGL